MAVVLGQSGQAGRGRRARCGRGAPAWSADPCRVNDLSNLLEATEQIIGQTRQRIAGVKWRTGSEGRISYLKRGFGWDRSRSGHLRCRRCGYGR